MSGELRIARGWESLWRMQFEALVDGHRYVLQADVLDWNDRCTLYKDGAKVGSRKSPATFKVGGKRTIEARIGWFGMRRAHLVTPSGATPLAAVKGGWEYRRAFLRRRFPILMEGVYVVALMVLIVAVAIEATQSLMWVTRNDWWANLTSWTYTAPFDLPLAANIGLTVAGIAAALLCLLRLRRRWPVDPPVVGTPRGAERT